MTDWVEQATMLNTRGMEPADIARALIDQGSGPIEAVKALRSIGIGLQDGKFIVDAALPVRERVANERLRDDAQRAAEALPFRLLRVAVWQLSLEPDEQRLELKGMAVTDELALDLDNAIASLEYEQESSGLRIADDVLAGVQLLNALVEAPPDDALWQDESLDRHPAWAAARRVARELLPLLPSA